MGIRDYLYITIISLLLYVFLTLHLVSGFALVEFQFVWGVSIYFAYRYRLSLIAIFLVLFIADASLGLNPSFGLISFALAGLGVTVVSKLLPIGKKAPFLAARVLWLLLSLLSYNILVLNGRIAWAEFLGSLLLNSLLLVLVTLALESRLTASKSQEILIA